MQYKSVVLLLAFVASFALAWPYGERKIRGVNAASWLVLEKWMNPTNTGVYAGLPNTVNDEYELCEYLGKEVAKERLTAHWNTWVTESDFEFWASTGLNHVRLPIGYWALDIQEGEPWVEGSWEYVVKAAGWCKKYGLQLMIDLHGAPGSQNGWDHSGHSGNVGFFTNENIDRAVRVIGQIASWSNSTEWRDTVTAIQLINEPTLWDDYNFRLGKLKDYYGLAYHEVRKYNPDVVVVVSDAFIDVSNWYYFTDLDEYHTVMVDIHRYQVFGDEWGQMNCSEHRNYPCTYHEPMTEANNKIWTFIGEWSLATPGELNCDGQDVFARQQIAAFEKTEGWIMWACYNGNNMNEWSFKHSYENKWIDPAGNNYAECSAGTSNTFALSVLSFLLFVLIKECVM